MTSIKDISYTTRSAYGGDDIRRVEKSNPSAKTKDSTHTPFYKTQISYSDNNEVGNLNDKEIDSIVNNDAKKRTNMDINTISEMMNSKTYLIREKLFNDEDKKNKVL